MSANTKQNLILRVVGSIDFIYGKQKTHFKVSGAKVYDLTNNKEFDITLKGVDSNNKLNFNTRELFESGRTKGINIQLTEEQAKVIKCLITVIKKKDRELVEVQDTFIERKDREKLNIGRTFTIGNKVYAYRYYK